YFILIISFFFFFFYAPWCGYSKPIHPIFDDLAKKVSHLKNLKIAKIDATVEHISAQKYKLTGYPSFRFFPAGNKKSHTALDYNQGRTLDDFYKFLLNHYSEKKKLIQLTSKQVLDEHCETGICILAILPNMQDVTDYYFISYINTLNDVIKDISDLPVTLLWTPAGDQLDIVNKLNLSYGFPTVIAISFSKNVFATLIGNYSKESIKKFITQMMIGKASVYTLTTFTVKTVSKIDLDMMQRKYGNNSDL
uniref:protein disulfide-isomerase n=1 Tax=Piliocolobus tephrosceles TaxID=591936 RepID=A0A8C9I5T5_9PRIM